MERGICLALLLFVASPPGEQNNLFQPSLLDRPDMRRAIHSVNEHAPSIIDEWVRLVQTPAPSGKEQARAEYIRAEMKQAGLIDIRTDDMLNVSGVLKGTGSGPTVVFAAHMDTVFPDGTDLTVKRNGDVLSAPGVGDDTGNLIATLEMFRALERAGVKTKGDLVFLASVQEEFGLLGAAHWLKTSGCKPDMFVAIDGSSTDVWYGALRIEQFKFVYTSAGAHTLQSRGAPNPARAVASAITALYKIPLPPIAEGLGTYKLPVLNVGMLGGGTVVNASPREAWFTVDLRSTDSATEDRLKTAVESIAHNIADEQHVGFRMEHTAGIDYSRALPPRARLHLPLVQTAAAVANHFRRSGTPEIVPIDVGSTDANIAVSLSIPAVSMGAVIGGNFHRPDEYAEASSIVPGIKSLIALAVAISSH